MDQAKAEAEWSPVQPGEQKAAPWYSRLCQFSGHAAVVRVVETETVLVQEAPAQRAHVDLLWASDESAYLSSQITFEQYGGCLGGDCWGNNAVHHVQAGEVWLLFLSPVESPVTPIAMGRWGMFRVTPLADHLVLDQAAFAISTVSGRTLFEAGLGLTVGAVVESPQAQPLSVVEVATTILAGCAAKPSEVTP